MLPRPPHAIPHPHPLGSSRLPHASSSSPRDSSSTSHGELATSPCFLVLPWRAHTSPRDSSSTSHGELATSPCFLVVPTRFLVDLLCARSIDPRFHVAFPP